jgi:hypothetical protein
VQVSLDNNTISEYSFVEEGMSSLGYDSLNEVFFDVFEIKFKNIELVKEKKGDFNGNPIIEVDLRIKNEIFKNVRFVLSKENKIKINPNLLDYTKVVVYESKNKITSPITITEKVENKPISRPVIKKKKTKSPKPIIVEQNLIEKTKESFFESIKGEVLEELKREVKVGIISDLIKESLQSNFDQVITDSGSKNKLQKIIENFNNSFRREYIDLAEKVSRREAMRYVESGGGTNATQYANGGTINGELIINGNLTVNNQKVIKKVIFDVGDGMQQSFIFNHNLNNKNILVNVQDTTTNEIVIPYIKIIDENSLMIEFSFIPDINNYKLIIFG